MNLRVKPLLLALSSWSPSWIVLAQLMQPQRPPLEHSLLTVVNLTGSKLHPGFETIAALLAEAAKCHSLMQELSRGSRSACHFTKLH